MAPNTSNTDNLEQLALKGLMLP